MSKSCEAKWRRNIRVHSSEIISCLDPLALNPYFEKHELFNPDEKDVLSMDTKSRREKVRHILGVLDATGKFDAHSIFVKCLAEEVCQGEGCHMGHQYLLALIKGEKVANADELKSSEQHRRSILKHRKELQDINLKSLVATCDVFP